MRLTSPLTFLLPLTLLLACNGGGDETGTSLSSNPSTSDTPSTGGPTTGAPTTGSATTGEPTTGTTGPGTGSESASSSSTGEPGTGSSTTTGEPGTSTGSTGPVDSSTGEPDTSGSSGETGVVPLDGCVTDKDCALHNDCCDCYGEAADDPDAICKKGCDTLTCDLLGIDQAVCRFGVCTTEKVDCDATKVLCDSLPPECPKGQAAAVVNGCWSGQCVPALSCNFVADCGVCPAGTMCVTKQAQLPTQPTCEPIPAECDGKVDCKCAGTFACTDMFNACNEAGANALVCNCPAC